MESDQKHLTSLTNIPLKSTLPETSLSESSSLFKSSSSESNSSESSISETSSSETSLSESNSSDSDINEIVNMVKHQRIWKRLARRKNSGENAYNKNKAINYLINIRS